MMRYVWLVILLVLLGVAYYLHWDDRLVQVFREQQTSQDERKASIWLNRYAADIQAKPVDSLLKAETSGLTWHEPSNTLFTITGKIPKLAQLSPDGMLLREIELTGVADPEGVTALSDGRFALVDERRSTLVVFSLPFTNTLDLSEALQIRLELLDEVFLEPDNKGLEGLTWDAANSRFILAKERNPYALYTLEFDLANNSFGRLDRLPDDKLFVRDISGLALEPDTGHLLVLSDDSGLLLELDELGEPVSFLSFIMGFNGLYKNIKQAEGVAIDSNGVIYVVGEPNLFYRFIPTEN